MDNKTKSIRDRNSFNILCFLIIIMFIIPPVGQKLFRIFLGCYLLFLYFSNISTPDLLKNLPKTHYIYSFGSILFVLVLFLFGQWQSSIINIFLFSFGIVSCLTATITITPERDRILTNLMYGSAISMSLQFVYSYFYYERLSLGYEVNLSGVYILLFIALADRLQKYMFVFIGILFSFLLISRMCTYCIVVFYLLKFLNIYKLISKIKWPLLVILVITITILFSYWFVEHVEITSDYQYGTKRLFDVSDRSNLFRFTSNTLVIDNLKQSDFDSNLLFGYGDLSDDRNKWYDLYIVMPHNEFCFSIAEFGVFATLFFGLFNIFYLGKHYDRNNYNLMVMMLFSSTVLWIRFCILPSPEMLFAILVMNIVTPSKNIERAVCENDENCIPCL